MIPTRGRIDVHGRSVKGRGHLRNHDHFAIADLNKSMKVHQTNLSIDDESRIHGHTQGHVFLIADGVSDAPAPSRASVSAVDSVVRYFLNEMPWYHLADGRPEDVTLALEEALRNVQDELRREAREPANRLATHLTMAFVVWPTLFLAHLGQSRCYVLRNGALRRATTGPDGERVRVGQLTLEVGDVVALCTEGIAERRTTADIMRALERPRSAAEMCRDLVGGDEEEDRTAIVARFLPSEPSRSETDAAQPILLPDVRLEEPKPELVPVRNRPENRTKPMATVRAS